MKMIFSATMVAFAFASATAFAEESFSLKGFSLGQPLNTCPTGSRLLGNSAGFISCSIGPTTYAGTQSEKFYVTIVDGKIAGAQIHLGHGGPNGHSSVADAMIEKFGLPSFRKDHINELKWEKGNQILSFDGWKGVVLMVDLDLYEKGKAARAAEGKKDL